MAGSHYRFYLKRDGHTFEVLECDLDGAAMPKARELLANSTTFHLMEIWQGETSRWMNHPVLPHNPRARRYRRLDPSCSPTCLAVRRTQRCTRRNGWPLRRLTFIWRVCVARECRSCFRAATGQSMSVRV